MAVRDALVRTHDVLQTAGRIPPPIPPNIFDRVETALRAESEARAQSTGVVSMATARERRFGGWKTKVLGVAAALALFGGGGAVLVQVMQPESNLAVPPPPADQEPSTKQAPGEAAPEDTSNDTRPLTASGFDVGVRELLKGAPEFGGEHGAVAPDPLADLHPGDAICVSNLQTQAGAGRILAVAETTFDGDQVILMVTESTEPDSVHGYAIGGCPTEAAKILHDEVVAK